MLSFAQSHSSGTKENSEAKIKSGAWNPEAEHECQDVAGKVHAEILRSKTNSHVCAISCTNSTLNNLLKKN